MQVTGKITNGIQEFSVADKSVIGKAVEQPNGSWHVRIKDMRSGVKDKITADTILPEKSDVLQMLSEMLGVKH